MQLERAMPRTTEGSLKKGRCAQDIQRELLTVQLTEQERDMPLALCSWSEGCPMHRKETGV